MARPKSEFLKSLGVFFEIARSLINEVMSLGGSDDDIRRILTDSTLRTRIAKLIVPSSTENSANSWVLDLHPTQKNGHPIRGVELEKYYDSPQFTGRHLSLESPLVKDWIANPETYPEEMRGKFVHLWGSRRGSDRDRDVACLYFEDGKVIVCWYWIDDLWHSNYPALLAAT